MSNSEFQLNRADDLRISESYFVAVVLQMGNFFCRSVECWNAIQGLLLSRGPNPWRMLMRAL